METNNTISAEALRTAMENDEPVFILDVRPVPQRAEWQIPGSHYIDAYKRLNEGDTSVLDEIEIPVNIKVITVCAAGRISQIAADALREKGIDAYSLEGGMKAWSTAWNTASISFPDFEIIQFRRTGKGCLSYMIASNGEAMIVDASLPVEVYSEDLQQQQLTLKYVADTHIHADHLSRSKQLAETCNATLCLPENNKVDFDYHAVEDDAVLNIGTISIKAIHTPGHTVESTCYLINDKVLLTGDTLFINGVGRPDLKANNEEAMQKSKLLFYSLQHLLMLNDDTIVLPCHTSKPVEFNHIPVQATLGSIKETVFMLHLNEQEFTNTILQRIPPTPANYLSIVEKNIKGNFSDINPADLEAGANRCAIS